MNTILIVEDEPQIRKNIQQILDLEGFATITAEDGLEGLDMVEKHQPDMIICDVMMPNLDGYGLIEALRQKPSTADIPLIFLTAKAENRDLRQGMDLGADDYLIKPFKADELIRAISTRFEKRQVLTQRYKTQIETQVQQLAAIEATIDGIAILRDNKFIFLNKAHIQMFGYDTAEELIGKYWTELYKLDEIARIEQKVFPILGETGYWRGEAIAKRRDGSIFNEEVSLTITHDGELICVCRDITEGKKAQAKLQESEQRFRQLAENLHQVFWMSDPKTSQIIYISPAYEEIWGLSCASLYENPKSFIDSIYPDDLQKFMMVMQNKKNGFYIEYRIKRPDGSIRWIHDRAFPLKDATGQVYRIVGIAEDITQRKQVETEIQKALAKEKELSELKSRFVSMTSHEFRTPLAVISSSAEILKTFGHILNEESKREHLECIQTYIGHTTQLLDDILLINKAETENLAFEPASLDLVPFCQVLTKEIQLSASNHTIVFSSNSQSNVIGNFDKKILRQILINLLSNAIKYSPNSAIVNFNLDITESIVIFSIQDQGIGIPEADQVKLFESFHRAKNVGDIPGSGLGLSIVAKCVDLHKGAISVNSELGKGTTFIVKIPLNK